LLVVTQRTEVSGQVAGRDESVGMVVTQHSTKAGQRVLINLAGPLMLTHRAQHASEMVGCAQRVRMIVPERIPPQLPEAVAKPYGDNCLRRCCRDRTSLGQFR
jgi:hypothetical protein